MCASVVECLLGVFEILLFSPAPFLKESKNFLGSRPCQVIESTGPSFMFASECSWPCFRDV